MVFLDDLDTQAIGFVVAVVAKEWHLSVAPGASFSASIVGSIAGSLRLTAEGGHRRLVA